MKLNYECVRAVMLYLESSPYVCLSSDGDIEYDAVWFPSICEAVPDYSKEEIYYALSNLEQGGFIDMSEQWGGDVLSSCCVNYITFDGHEFLEKIKSDTAWKKTIGIAGKIGNFSLNMLAKISEGVATAYLNKQLLGN